MPLYRPRAFSLFCGPLTPAPALLAIAIVADGDADARAAAASPPARCRSPKSAGPSVRKLRSRCTTDENLKRGCRRFRIRQAKTALPPVPLVVPFGVGVFWIYAARVANAGVRFRGRDMVGHPQLDARASQCTNTKGPPAHRDALGGPWVLPANNGAGSGAFRQPLLVLSHHRCRDGGPIVSRSPRGALQRRGRAQAPTSTLVPFRRPSLRTRTRGLKLHPPRALTHYRSAIHRSP